MKQILPKEFCLKCQGCCRFLEQNSTWRPCVLENEAKILSKKSLAAFISADKKILTVPSEEKGIFFCHFLNQKNNKCSIYAFRPFECRLYPFMINKAHGKVYLCVDLNCPFAKDNQGTKAFLDYAKYLAALLNKKAFIKALKENPQIIQSYPQVTNIAEIKL